MNHAIKGLQTLGLMACYSLIVAIFPKMVAATQPSSSQPSSQNPNRSLIAQRNDCREVDVNTALNVRQQPGGQVIGTLENQQNVYISGEPQNGWVRIENPMNGYVFARYLNYCTEAASPPQTPVGNTPTTPGSEGISTVPGSNCRQVISSDVSVRSEPNGEIIATLSSNQTVYIANEGNNGWVPIERPVNGYVSSSNLGQCSQ